MELPNPPRPPSGNPVQERLTYVDLATRDEVRICCVCFFLFLTSHSLLCGTKAYIIFSHYTLPWPIFLSPSES